MTNKEAKEKLYVEWQKFLEDNIDYAGVSEAYKMAFKALAQQSCEDTISRKALKHKLQEHHDFLVNTYGGFSNLPQNDKTRVDEISNCIAMVVNEPSVKPQEKIGHWIERRSRATGHIEIVCSECGAEKGYPYDDYCGNCGTKMVNEQESEKNNG